MSIWIICLLCFAGLWYLHLIVGMGYRWFSKGTSLGIQSFSSLAYQCLWKKERKGIVYLSKTLLLLEDLLKHDELELKTLDSTIRTVKCLLCFKSNIPYDRLQMLAMELKKFPSFKHTPRCLMTFNNDTTVKWTKDFTDTESLKKGGA